MKIDRSAYDSLEMSRVLSIIRRDCRSDLGALAISAMTPARDRDELASWHDLFKSVESYRDTRGDLPWNFKLSSVRHLMDDAKSSGMLLGGELLQVRRLLEGAARIKEALVHSRSEWPAFSILIKDLRDFTIETEALSVIDEDGRLYDHASDRLRKLRLNMRRIRDQVRRKGQGILSNPSLSSMLQERVLTLRNGRHAVLVRQDAISNFPGLVMDRSGSGNSIYMEPHALVALNNEHAVCAEDESAEERRILHRLTERVLERESAITDAEMTLGRIDLFYAMSEKIRRDHWHMPMLAGSPVFGFYRAKHPLLADSAVPIDISCGEKFRVLVVTGPNTGGKTVALKTAGVCVCLGWLGCPIPAEENSILGIVDDIYSDIGDEQSIEQNLSTFSAHVSQITKILERAGENSVVLLDELGAGTDPDEGAALGIAILDWLVGRKSMVIATTHHNPIKRYALSTPGVESASVEFNASTLSPTYRLLIGIPGRSNALLIAGKLGMPESVLLRAREALHRREVSMEDIIGELQEKRTAVEQENRELEELRANLDVMRREYEEQMNALSEKRDKLLAEADRKALGIVENAETSAKSLLRTIDEEARSAAHRKLERSRKHFGMIREQAEKREDERLERTYAPDERPLAAGDRVVVIGSSTVGTLECVEGDKATVTAGAARLELPLKMLRSATREEGRQENRIQRSLGKNGITLTKQEGAGIKITPPPRPAGVPSSIMIRGMTSDEAIPMAAQYLDRAYRAGYGEVSVIHGRGEGILRREVQNLCRSLPYVESYRLGEAGEGGFGVTIVRFKA
ncbi:MAG: Smr/MutS family protein [Synergistaceae bacterium]|jgi:DNA mismatch repair protein MutS2|nr:Smr/MutS family protein [Synergistaceae bacterium]